MKKTKDINKKRLETFTEFFIFGLLMGIVEDVIAITLATDEEFSLKILGIIVLVALPFAVIGELIVDREDIDFYQKLKEKLKK